uniref:Uncharacterized protein n=1 Tax=Rhodopseudomonas palustris (strain DX-1) TaxID=652103 RepID=E6VIU3_RHOPX
MVVVVGFVMGSVMGLVVVVVMALGRCGSERLFVTAGPARVSDREVV